MAKKEKQETGDAEISFPELSDATLTALTSKIESKLHTPKSSKPAPKPASKPASKPAPKSSPKSSKSTTPKTAEKGKPTTSPAGGRGQKRKHNGDVVESGKQPAKKAAKSSKNDDLDAMRNEIIALGGTEEDLALIADLNSDSEVEGDTQPAKKKSSGKEDGLQKDVAKLLKDMGVEDSRATATTADSDEEMEDIIESEEEEEDEDEEEQGNSQDAVADKKIDPFQEPTNDKKGSSRLSITPQPNWFEIAPTDLSTIDKTEISISKHVLDHVHKYAKELLDTENETYQKNQKSASSSQKFYAQVISSGTLTDKISALTLAVQESPLHNVKALETLMGLARKKSRSQAIDVLRALKDLFAQGSLLPSDRRLRTFSTQPALLSAFVEVKTWNAGQALPRGVRPQHLMLWAYEHWLKDVYFEVLKILENWCNDELEFSKTRALSYVYELLKEKPEQETNLLRLLVNKLGDRTKKVASRASYLLLQLQSAHPVMKGTIVSAIENELLWRPGQNLHAKYYAVVTLNQTILSTKEEPTAAKLLEIYFALFVALLKPADSSKSNSKDKTSSKKNNSVPSKESGKVNVQDDDLQEKLTSAILTGINRAYPYVTAENENVGKHMDTLFRITHSSNFNTSIQAMMLIQQLTVANQMSSDRFYRTLYESLLDPRLMTTSKQSLYLNLLFKSLKADLNIKRVKAFVKRILQIVTLHQPSFVVGCFHLLKELEVTFPSLKALIDQPEEHEDEEEHFRDVDEDNDGENPTTNTESKNQALFYDSKKRDPEHSNADRSCLWELLPYVAHYHPSVSVGADSILNHTPLSGKPDLNLYTLIHFLDRFVYRNPKATESSTLRGSSIMQPMLAGDATASLFSTLPGQRQIPVNSESFWKKNSEDVSAEDAFFHQYFSSIGKDRLSKKKTKAPEDDEEDEEGGEDAIWKAITESRPDLEADESDDDLDLDDLESELDDSEDDDLGLEDMDEDLDDEGLSGDEGSGVELVGFDDESAEEQSGASAGEEDDEEEDEDEEEEEAEEEPAPKKKSKKEETQRERKKRLKALPTFASVADYAAMLEDDSGEDRGY